MEYYDYLTEINQKKVKKMKEDLERIQERTRER